MEDEFVFTLAIGCDNDAFTDDRHAEIARILRWCADRLERTHNDTGNLFDLNGNRVGSYSYGAVAVGAR